MNRRLFWLTALESRKSRTEGPASGGGFLLCHPMAKGRRRARGPATDLTASCPLLVDVHPSVSGEPSGPQHLPLGPPSTVALGVKCPTQAFWGIHSSHSTGLSPRKPFLTPAGRSNLLWPLITHLGASFSHLHHSLSVSFSSPWPLKPAHPWRPGSLSPCLPPSPCPSLW